VAIAAAMLVLAVAAVGVPAPASAATPPASATEPLYPTDFPDPSLLRAAGRVYAYATNGPQGNVQLIRATSADLRSWERLPDALPKLPTWAAPDRTWAPSVLARSATSYVLYFSARHAGTGRQCIGRAVATKPEGPFVDELPQPFVCQFDLGGSIDPEPVVDADGAPWLLFKSEGISGREPTRLFSQPLAADGRSTVGDAVELVHTDQAWEEPIVEGPAMVRAAGAYWLLYAGNHWSTGDYAIGYARCTSMRGPCTKDPTNPLVTSTATMAGPGSPGVTTAADGSLLLTFHAWTTGKVGYPGGARTLRALPLTFVAGKPTVPGTARRTGDGYRLVASDGGVFSYGSATFHGSTGDLVLNQPIRTLASTPSGAGYWMAASDGGIFAFGDAGYYGSTGDRVLNSPIVAMAPTPTGRGYWLTAADGGVFTFGDARFLGSTGSRKLNQPIVAMTPTVTGRGYWLVASDGGIFSFGDAAFFGSTGALRLNSPITAMVATPWSDGYWLVAADGGVFAFGAAPFLGSTGDLRLNSPIVGASATPAGDGYWFVAADGGVFAFGRAGFFGSAGGSPLNRPVVGFAA
jgi:hypothetical protein